MNRLELILAQANKDDWDAFIPSVPMRLKLAVDALHRSSPKFWTLSAAELEQLLQQHPVISAQFNARDQLAIAFAIRTLRMQTPGPS